MLDIVNNVVYSNSGTGTLTYKQEPLEIDDPSLVFKTTDGIRDLSGKNTITNNGAIVGKEMIFDTTTDKLDLGSGFIGAGDVTVIAVININSYGGGSYGRIIDNGKFIFYVNNGVTENELSVSSVGGGTFVSSPDNTILTGIDYHVATVRRTDGTADLYINGVLVGTGITGTPDAGTNNVLIGNNSSNTRNFDGKIHSVKIYNEVKSAEFIKEDYNKSIRYW
jgi:hypothetical protein